ncbi:MAG: hypothetical protein Q9194_003041 [Teloschistes cf. exilis]
MPQRLLSLSRCYHITAVLFFVTLVSASPLIPVEKDDTKSLSLLVANASSLGIDLSGVQPPPQLNIQIGRPRNPLPEIPHVYLLTLSLASKLAGYPSDGKQNKAIKDSIRKAPGYLLSMKGHLRDGGFEINLMLWGLQFAMQWMVQMRLPFYERAFTVRWEETYVGTITYTYSPLPSVLDVGNFTALASLSDALDFNGVPSTTPSNAMVKFEFRSVPGAVSMDLSSIAMTLLAGFIIINAHGVDSRVPSGNFQAGEAHYRPRIQLVAKLPSPARVVPDWYTYNVPRSMLAQLAILYLYGLPGKGRPTAGCNIEMLNEGTVAGTGNFGIPRGGASAIVDGGDTIATL